MLPLFVNYKYMHVHSFEQGCVLWKELCEECDFSGMHVNTMNSFPQNSFCTHKV